MYPGTQQGDYDYYFSISRSGRDSDSEDMHSLLLDWKARQGRLSCLPCFRLLREGNCFQEVKTLGHGNCNWNKQQTTLHKTYWLRSILATLQGLAFTEEQDVETLSATAHNL